MAEKLTAPCGQYYEIFTTRPDPDIKYQFLSPFELKNNLIKLAETKAKKLGMENILNAGRGNPDWFDTVARYGFGLLNNISTRIGDEDTSMKGLGLMPEQKGISKRFGKHLRRYAKTEEGKFLKKAVAHMWRIVKEAGMTRDEFIHNLVVSSEGCFYPDPPRVQPYVEPVLTEFLSNNIFRPKVPLTGRVDLFPTEGATAAIIYIFNSLKLNDLVVEGDTIGILSPIFSPYLEIPGLKNYNLKMVCIQAEENLGWEIPDSELEKIRDKNMKALFLVNPSNPESLSLSHKTTRSIRKIVKKDNPNLIILTDNVYIPFVNEFHSLFDVLPANCIAVYSFSKYFGCTGFRLGVIMMSKNNIIDRKLLKDVPDSVNKRYKMMTLHPEKIKFIDRLLADSRQVAEAHTAGESTSQQVMMTLFATREMMDKSQAYNKQIKRLLKKRILNLTHPLSYPINETPRSANYYIVLDVQKAADILAGGTDFGSYLVKHRDPIEFVFRLAKDYATVVLSAIGFGASPEWTIRVSLANLPTEDYVEIGQNIRSLIEEYYKEMKEDVRKGNVKGVKIVKKTKRKPKKKTRKRRN